MNFSTLILAFLLFGSTAALFWFLLRHGAERTLHQFRLLGETLGLEVSVPAPKAAGFVRGEPSAYGRWRGRETSVSVPGTGLQGTRQVETVLKMELREKGFQLQATVAGVLGSMRQRDGEHLERWKSGELQFDQAIDLRTSDPKRTSAVLDPRSRGRLADLLKAGKATLYLSRGVMAFVEYGLLTDDAARKRFEEAANVLDELARGLEKGTGSAE